MIKEFISRQFLIFLFTGGIAATVNFGSRILYNQWIDFSVAVILAYITGMVMAFILAKLFVFTDSRQGMRHSILYFCLVNLIAVCQTWLISMLLAYYILPFMGVSRFVPEMAHAVGVIMPVFTSYIGHKRLSFR